jgi:hypothetical protein
VSVGTGKLTKRDIALRQWWQRFAWINMQKPWNSHDVREDVLGELSDADLKEVGVTLGDRKRLLKAVSRLTGSQAASGTNVSM